MSEWKTVRLGDVCEILNGYAFKSDKYVDSGIRVIRITNVQKGFIEDNSPAFYPITEKETLKDYELHENDLLISLTGNVGRVALLSKEMLPAALNQRVGCIRIRDKNLLISYLFTFLNSDKFESDCIYSARGIAQKNMSTEWLKNYLIPLPPIEVQIKIANNLNTCAKIIKKHNKQLNNFDLLIKSRFIEMFEDNPVENGKWKVEKLGNLVTVTSSKRIYAEEQSTEGIPFLRISDLVSKINGIDSNDLYIPEEKYHEFVENGLVPNVDDILVTSRGTLGLCYTITADDKFYFQDGMITWLKFSNHESILSIFLSFLFNVILKQKIDLKTNGATVKYVSISELKNLEIPVPPLELQQQFAAFVQQIDKSKFAVQKSLEKTEILYKSLMQAYFG